MVSQRGIEVDPDKIKAIVEMKPPRIEKEIQGFLGRIQYIACSLPSAEDRSNIILEVSRSNHKEQGKFKDNIIKQQFG